MFTSLRYAFAGLAFALAVPAQQLTFVPFHSNGIYALGEKAGWTVSAPKDAAASPTKYTYEIKKNNFSNIKTGTLDLSSGSATIEATLPEPGTLYVTVTAEGAPPTSAVHLGAAIAPTQLLPDAPRPPDFDAFWLNKIQYLSITPMRADINPVHSPQDRVELSTVQADSYGSRMHGYFAKPVKLGKFPALVIYQSEGIGALDPNIAADRAAEGWMTFEAGAHDMLPQQSAGVPPNFPLLGDFNREQSYLLFMYLRAARAVDFVCSQPDWDGDTIVLMGEGMGAQQALVVAGLRRQVSAVIANRPTGADISGEMFGRKPGFPNWPSADPRAMATAPYFDVVNFTGRIRGSVLVGIGLTDTNAPAAGIWTAFNEVTGPKQAIATPDTDDSAFHARAKQMLDSMLHGVPLPPSGK
jgi:cephalosporin-C deacetylase-like acetyl esterase